MKKYIVAQLFFLQFIVLQLIAMDKPCYFVLIPRDVCNIIASFLVWESEEEFVKRTQEIPALPLNSSRYEPAVAFSCGSQEMFRVMCPDKTKTAIVKLFYYDQAQPSLTVVNHQCKDEVIYDGKFTYKLYEHVALSQCGYMIATIHKQERSSDETFNYYKNILVIQKIIIEKKEIRRKNIQDTTVKKLRAVRSLNVPDKYAYTGLAFNKQGTHIVMHISYCNGVESSRKKKHMIIPLKAIDDKKTIATVEKANELQNYFKHNLVCKNITGV